MKALGSGAGRGLQPVRLPAPPVRVADVILPIGALPEIDATLTNLEGRDQVAVPAGKLPGEARAGWRVLRALGGELAAPGFEFTDLAGLRARHASPQDGRRRRRLAAAPASGTAPASKSRVIAGDLSRRRRRAPRRGAAGASADARRAHRAASGRCAGAGPCRQARSPRSTNGVGTATLPVAISDQVAPRLRLDRVRLWRDRAAGGCGNGGGPAAHESADDPCGRSVPRLAAVVRRDRPARLDRAEDPR